MKYVLDTNVVARLLDNGARVARRFAAVTADSVGMPLVVLADGPELIFRQYDLLLHERIERR